MKRLTQFQERQLAYLKEHGGVAPTNGKRWWSNRQTSRCFQVFEANGYTVRDGYKSVLTELGEAYLAKYKPDWKELLLETQALRDYDKAQLVYAFLHDGELNWRKGSYQVRCTYVRLKSKELISASYGGSRIWLRDKGKRYARLIQNDVDLSVLGF